LRPVPVASLRLLSIALCVDCARVYDAGGCALTARCPLVQPYPFPLSTAQSTAKSDMRSGSELSLRIDLRGMWDARAQRMSLRLRVRSALQRLFVTVMTQTDQARRLPSDGHRASASVKVESLRTAGP